MTVFNSVEQVGSGNTTGINIGTATTPVGFYGVTPVAQRVTSSVQVTSNLATVTTGSSSQFGTELNAVVIALQEVMNTLQAYGLWGTH